MPLSDRRIALVLSELRAGGAEWVVVHLAAELARRGAAPIVVSLGGKGELGGALETAGVPVAALESCRGYDLPAMVRLGRLLRRFRPHVLNVHDLPSLPYVMLAAKLFWRRPVVFTAHGALYTGGFPRHRRYHRLAARGLAALTAVSEEAGMRHCEYFGLPGGFEVIVNGVPDLLPDPSQRRAARERLGLAEEQFAFLAAGNIRPEKGFDDLVEAAALLRRACPERPFTVLIAGTAADAAYYEQVLALRERLGMQGVVKLLGFEADMQALYAAADAFVLSSRCEGLPLVVLECMMAARPLVGTRVGAVPDVLDHGAGLVVPPAAPEPLAGAMRQLLLDPALCRRLAEAARQKAVERYSVRAMTDGYMAVFERVASC